MGNPIYMQKDYPVGFFILSLLSFGVSVPIYLILWLGAGMSPVGAFLPFQEVMMVLLPPVVACLFGSFVFRFKPKVNKITQGLMVLVFCISGFEILFVLLLLMD